MARLNNAMFSDGVLGRYAILPDPDFFFVTRSDAQQIRTLGVTKKHLATLTTSIKQKTCVKSRNDLRAIIPDAKNGAPVRKNGSPEICSVVAGQLGSRELRNDWPRKNRQKT